MPVGILPSAGEKDRTHVTDRRQNTPGAERDDDTPSGLRSMAIRTSVDNSFALTREQKEAINRHIVQAWDKAGRNQSALARAWEVNQSTVSEYVKHGVRRPTVGLVRHIARSLGISMDEVIGDPAPPGVEELRAEVARLREQVAHLTKSGAAAAPPGVEELRAEVAMLRGQVNLLAKSGAAPDVDVVALRQRRELRAYARVIGPPRRPKSPKK